jgi:GTPase SAR1 family protein
MENNNKEDYKVDEQNKIYIVGGRGVGKTTFLYQIHSGTFNDSLPPSEIGIAVSQYKIGNKEFTIKDLTDDENFSKTNILKNELEDVILIFVLFALDDKDSFEHAKNLIQFIKNNLINNEEMNIFLLGNKQDLVEANPKGNIVERKEIDQYIFNIENLRYYEISCKTNYNISIIKEMIDGFEIEEEKDEDDDKIPEEERKKKVNEAKGKSCLLF